MIKKSFKVVKIAKIAKRVKKAKNIRLKKRDPFGKINLIKLFSMTYSRTPRSPRFLKSP